MSAVSKAPAPAVFAAPASVTEYISRGVAPAATRACSASTSGRVLSLYVTYLSVAPAAAVCALPELLRYAVRFLPETMRRHTF